MRFGEPREVSHIIKQKAGPDDPELAETLEEALAQADPTTLVAIADELAVRHTQWAPSDDLTEIARAVTSSRKSAAALTAYLSEGDSPPSTRTLFGERVPAGDRIAAFTAQLNGLDPRLGLELATGLLHLQSPAKYWLWTRWMWDAQKQTGILPLLTGGLHHLQAAGIAEGYIKVDAATALSMRFAERTGLLTPDLTEHPQRRAFASDVFLACAYSVYMYGITSWRLSREYNRLMPTLPNMMRKLLGLSKRK